MLTEKIEVDLIESSLVYPTVSLIVLGAALLAVGTIFKKFIIDPQNRLDERSERELEEMNFN